MKKITLKKTFITVFGILVLFFICNSGWSLTDPDAGWDASQQEEDNFYSGSGYEGCYDSPGFSSDGGGNLNSLSKNLSEAKAALDKVKANSDAYTEDQKQAVEERFTRAQEKIESYCESKGYSVDFSSSGGFGVVYDSKGKVVSTVGDPVFFSKGYYIHSVDDYEKSFGDEKFLVNRCYRSFTDASLLKNYPNIKEGIFGKYWTSSLDARIIFGTMDYSSIINTLETSLKNSQESLKEIKDIYQENFLCIYDDDDEDYYDDEEEVYEEENNLLSVNWEERYYPGFDYYEYEARLEEKNNSSWDDDDWDDDEDWDEYEENEQKEKIDSDDPKYQVEVSVLPAKEVIELIHYTANKYCTQTEQQLALFKTLQSKSEENRMRNKYVMYGMESLEVENLSPFSLVYIDEKGFPFTFEKKDGVWENVSGKNGFSLTEDLTGNFSVRYLNGGELIFNEHGQLKEKKGIHGNSTAFSYKDGFLQRAVINGSFNVDFEWKEGLVSKITDGGKSVCFFYKENVLEKVIDADGVPVVYEYENNLLSKVVKAGNVFSKIKYAVQNGKNTVSAVQNEEGFLEYFDYDFLKSCTVYTNHDGEKTSFYFDDSGRTVKEVYCDGRERHLFYNKDGLLEKEIFDGEETNFSYDENLFKTENIFSDGSKETYKYKDGVLSYFAGRDNYILSFYYDSRKNCIQTWRDGELLSKREYNDKGFLMAETDCRGFETRYSYDVRGNLIKKGGEVWSYDSKDRVKTYKNERGIVFSYEYGKNQIIITDGKFKRVTQTLDSRQNVICQFDEDLITGKKNKWEYFYDEKNRLKKGMLNGSVIKEISYSPGGKLVCQKIYGNGNFSPDGGSIFIQEKNWNSYGNLSSIENKTIDLYGNEISRSKTYYAFQNEGTRQRVKKTYSDGNFEEEVFYNGIQEEKSVNGETVRNRVLSNSALILEEINGQGGSEILEWEKGRLSFRKQKIEGRNGESYEYYPDNLIKSVRVPQGILMEFFYGKNGCISRIESPAGKKTFEYDSGGRLCLIQEFNENGKLVFKKQWIYNDSQNSCIEISGGYIKKKYFYDSNGNIICIADGLKNKTEFEYDAFNRLVKISDAEGGKTRFFYNGLNQLTKIKDCADNETVFYYDEYGNLIRGTDGEGDIFQKKYDSRGNLLELWERAQTEKKLFTYDNFDRCIEIKQGGKVQSKTLISQNGKKITWFDGKNSGAEIETDGFGNVLMRKNRFSDEWKYGLDTSGDVEWEIDFNGTKKTVSRENYGLSVIEKFEDGSFTENRRDFSGRLVESKNENTTLSFEYDLAGKLVSYTDSAAGKKIEYKYDEVGNKIMAKSLEREITYQWDNLGRIKKISDEKMKASVSFKYNIQGQEIERKFSSGGKLISCYDKAGRLILRAGYTPNGKISFVSGRVFDEKGFVKYKLNSDFTVTKFSYDSAGRVCSAWYSYSEQLRHHFRELLGKNGILPGEKKPDFSSLEISDMDYEKLKNLCFLSDKKHHQLQLSRYCVRVDFEYDENGNLIVQNTPFGKIEYQYDSENRLVSWGKGCSAVYDKNGNMISKTTPGKSETYIYSKKNFLIESLEKDFTGKKYVQQKYKYDSLGRKIEIYNSKTGTKGIFYDGLTFDEFYSWNIAEHKNREKKDKTGYFDKIRYIDFDSYGKKTERIHENQNYPWEENSRIGSQNFFENNRHNYEGKENDVFDFPGEKDLRQFSSLSSENDENFLVLYDMTGNPMYYGSRKFDEHGKHTFLFTDALGTVCGETGSGGEVKEFSYDCFGLPFGGENPLFGFGGKKFQSGTEVYDFGYRNYSPLGAGFTSSDPAMFGLNWYSYCNGNPNNFVDFAGLKTVQPEDLDMHDRDISSISINGTQTTIGEAGCTIVGLSAILSELTGTEISADFLAHSDIFSDSAPDEIEWEKLCSLCSQITTYTFNDIRMITRDFTQTFNFSVERTTKKDGTTTEENIREAINNAEASKTLTGVLIEVEYTPKTDSKGNKKTHWTSAVGPVVDMDGKSYVKIKSTSIYDKKGNIVQGTVRYSVGWKVINNDVYVPLENIVSVVSLSHSKDR